jgi:hypothetical protein
MRTLVVPAIVTTLTVTLNAQEQLALSCSRDNQTVAVTLRNSGTALGPWMMALGREMEIGSVMGAWLRPALSLTTTDPASGGTRRYDYRPSGMPGIVAGRVDPWMLLLPPGASYTLQLPGDDFIDLQRGVRFDFSKLETSVATLLIRRAQDVPGPERSYSYTVTSRRLRTPEDCVAAAP